MHTIFRHDQAVAASSHAWPFPTPWSSPLRVGLTPKSQCLVAASRRLDLLLASDYSDHSFYLSALFVARLNQILHRPDRLDLPLWRVLGLGILRMMPLLWDGVGVLFHISRTFVRRLPRWSNGRSQKEQYKQRHRVCCWKEALSAQSDGLKAYGFAFINVETLWKVEEILW